MSSEAEVERPAWLTALVEGASDASGMRFLRPPEGDDGLRPAAVLALFGDGDRGPDVLLMQRNAHMRHHPGQPSFPGGRIDPDDAGPVEAALREAREETGLDPAGVEVLLTLPELWLPPSNSVVTPVVAWWRQPSAVSAVSPEEVDAVARVPVADLVDPTNRLMVAHPGRFEAPAFRVAGMLVWGFTAGILDWLLTAAGWTQPWDRSVVEPVPLPEAPA
jgi:8-oxo-dGTP pyrophosphatase MutT (NUDIX family)